MSDAEHSPQGSSQSDRTSGISRKAKAVIAGLTAVLTLATGTLTLRDQLFPSDDDPPIGPEDQVADVTNDAEAKSQANRLIDVLNECRVTTGRDYQGCNTGGILGASQVPIGTGAGRVALNVTSPVTFEITSRSASGHIFYVMKTAQGEEVRTCKPQGAGGCPQDGSW